MMKWCFVVLSMFVFLLFYTDGYAQIVDTVKRSAATDSIRTNTLDDVTVTAFSLQGKWQEAPAAIAVINQKQLQLLNNTSLVPIFNTVAGVRMEERSPGSYRLSIRGSLLRSPFGVRNVKIYWNDIPLTDGGGNTYLQLVDISQVQSAEVIKGPASSLYGANTGGAVILHAGNYLPKNHVSGSVLGGSYGLFSEWMNYSYSNQKFQTGVQQVHQQSDGYRHQSAMRKDVIKWDGTWQISPGQKLSFLSSYSDLYYQTPGGLTLNQFHTDTTAYPKAIINHAYVRNKTIFGGISLTSNFTRHYDNITTLTANHTSFINPTTRNYEERDENNYGARTTFSFHNDFKHISFKWLAGAEYLRNHSFIDDYVNDSGAKAAIMTHDELFATQSSLFTQLNIVLFKRLTLQAGVSSNRQVIRFRRPADSLFYDYKKSNTDALIAPRFSVLYNVVNDINLYAVIAKGFSPPTLEERHPSGENFNDSLHPEYGWNYEAGLKGSALQNKFLFDASAYIFRLRNAIVSRKSPTDADYFVNAGDTKQPGVEVWMKVFLYSRPNAFLSSLSVANSFAYQPYHFSSYIVGTSDYSGHSLTGVPRTINVSTIEAISKSGLYANLIFNTVSKVSLNDASTAFADPYHLLQAKIGFQFQGHHLRYQVFAGGDNLFNETYSLGNDINAAGSRYYNPAPKRNFYGGIQVNW